MSYYQVNMPMPARAITGHGRATPPRGAICLRLMLRRLWDEKEEGEGGDLRVEEDVESMNECVQSVCSRTAEQVISHGNSDPRWRWEKERRIHK